MPIEALRGFGHVDRVNLSGLVIFFKYKQSDRLGTGFSEFDKHLKYKDLFITVETGVLREGTLTE